MTGDFKRIMTSLFRLKIKFVDTFIYIKTKKDPDLKNRKHSLWCWIRGKLQFGLSQLKLKTSCHVLFEDSFCELSCILKGLPCLWALQLKGTMHLVRTVSEHVRNTFFTLRLTMFEKNAWKFKTNEK
jgi:hypothetical protein